MRHIYPHKFESIDGPSKTALNRICRRCKLGPGHQVHLLPLYGIKSEAITAPEPEQLTLIDDSGPLSNQFNLFN